MSAASDGRAEEVVRTVLEIVLAVATFLAFAIIAAMLVIGLMGLIGVVSVSRCKSCRRLVVSSASPVVSCPRCTHEWLHHPLHLVHPHHQGASKIAS